MEGHNYLRNPCIRYPSTKPSKSPSNFLEMGRLPIALCFLIVCMYNTSTGFGLTCNEAERNALLKFKHSFIDRFNHLGTWVGKDCCGWKGVGCDNITGNVVKLDLQSEEYSYLEAGEVNPCLLELKYLTYLDLSFVDFNGSRIPDFFGSMRQLEYLNLSNAYFLGKVPRNLGNLTKLVVLDMSRVWWRSEFANDEFLGPGSIKFENLHYRDSSSASLSTLAMEADNLEWAFKLESLQYLDLSGIDLSQALDGLNLVQKLPSLLVLNMVDCRLGNSHQVVRNSTVSSSPIHHLDLSGNLLSGPIPLFLQNLSSIRFLDLSSNYFSSSIPPWFGNKVDLKYLSLAYNNFNSSFPHILQNLTSLASLDLSGNQFSSSIPSWLANKRYLEYLSLGYNQFNLVDGGIMNIISNICSLKNLDLSYNQIQEDVSESHIYSPRCSKSSLKFLFLNNNNISGRLPITGSLSSLLVLDLSDNNLESLNPSLRGLSSLVQLDLSHNNFKVVPPLIGSLSSLVYLNLSYNHLSVVHQVSLANLSSLRNLDISSNPLNLDFSLEWLPPFQLMFLSLRSCKLNSPFPKWLLSQKRMLELDLTDAGIFGPLPDNIGNVLPWLEGLQLANNRINGSIPTSLCDSESLAFIDLQRNRLSGMIPDCWVNSRILGVNSQILGVDLSSNRLSGPIPDSLTKASTLQLLNLNNNSLEGELPLSWSNRETLRVLDLGKNNLHGEIPPWSGEDFPYLEVLILRENGFKGKIPPQLCSIPMLQVIDLARNSLAGTIPQCFGHFEGMGYIQRPSDLTGSPPTGSYVAYSPPVNSKEWSAVEVIKGAEREYTTILHLLVNMDLSCNNLVGVIPAELTSLSRLVSLNLSHNHLAGVIPKEIGKMESLEALDLSCNNLSGSIPQSISSLDFLSKMNLSFNNLQGEIPTGSQLQALDDQYSIYAGNPGLCGDPLPKKCFGESLAHSPTSVVLEGEVDSEHDVIWFYLIIMFGFATGFWGVIGILVVKRRWRHAYFQIAEDLVDWMDVVAVKIARTKRRK